MDENIDSGFLVDTEIDEGFSVDPYMVIYQVYAKLDDNKCITDIWSTGNQCLGDSRSIEEMQELGYVQIDEGSNGEIYGHAQPNYLKMKYGKTMYDEQMIPNFKYDDAVKEVEPTEKEEWFIKPQRIAQEKANQEAMLKTMMERQAQVSFLVELPDEEAVKILYCYDEWKVDHDYKVGDRVQDSGKLWKCRQEHTSQEDWRPLTKTASLWEVIDIEHEGTIDDPIPYDMNMEVFKDKYYIENDVVYKCIRDSEQPLYASCSSLLGNYFELVL